MTATSHTPAASGRSPSVDADAIPLWRLHAMRVGYAFMGVGLAVVKWLGMTSPSGPTVML